jgi:hypothetical protein
MTRRPAPALAAIAAVVAAALLLTSCTSHAKNIGDPGTTTPSSSSTTTASSPPTTSPTPSATTPTYDPKIKPAVAAYLGYIGAFQNALKNPSNEALRSAVAKYSFDPAGYETNVTLSQLAAAGFVDRGSPPAPRVSVLTPNLGAKPYPTVILTDCPTPGGNWATYDVKTGKKLSPASGKPRPPYLTTATVIFYKNHWGVRKAATDYTKTCSA